MLREQACHCRDCAEECLDNAVVTALTRFFVLQDEIDALITLDAETPGIAAAQSVEQACTRINMRIHELVGE